MWIATPSLRRTCTAYIFAGLPSHNHLIPLEWRARLDYSALRASPLRGRPSVFDDEYTETFRALIFAIRACGFQPRSARELDDSGQPRIEKLYGLIKEYRYGIHDLSRTEPDAIHHLPRFNMPLELGIFMGAKHYGAPRQRKKRLLIFDTEQYRYQKFISDLAGMLGSCVHQFGVRLREELNDHHEVKRRAISSRTCS